MAEEVNIMRGYFFMVLVAVQFGFQPLLARLYGSRSSSLGSVVIVGEASPLHAFRLSSFTFSTGDEGDLMCAVYCA